MKPNRCRKYPILLGLSLLLLLGSGLVPGTVNSQEAETQPGNFFRVQIKNSVTVTGDEIYLADIARLSAPPVLLEKGDRIWVAHAPAPGQDLVLNSDRITNTIRAKRWLPDEVQLSAPAHVFIKRAGQPVPQKKLRQLFLQHLQRQCDNSQVEISDFKIAGADFLPTGELAFRFATSDQDLLKRVRLSVKVLVDDRPYQDLTLSAWVNRYEKVVATKHQVRRQTILRKDDLFLKQINLSRAPANLIQSLDLAVGKQVSCDLMPGAQLRRNMLTEPYLVKRGDQIKIVAQSPFLKILTTGIAKSNGRKGEQIQVQNLDSRQTISARVAAADTVKVQF